MSALPFVQVFPTPFQVVTPAPTVTELIFMASEFAPRVTGGCAKVEVETGTHKITRTVLAFDPSTREHAELSFFWPEGWAQCEIEFHWYAPNTGGVCWVAAMRNYLEGATVDANYSASYTSVVGNNGAANILRKTLAGIKINPDGTETNGAMMTLLVYRDVADFYDDNTGDAYLIAVKVRKTA